MKKEINWVERILKCFVEGEFMFIVLKRIVMKKREKSVVCVLFQKVYGV